MEKGNNFGALPGPAAEDEVRVPDISGAELPSGFRVRERTGTVSGEADIYSCARGFGTADYAVRYYCRGNAVDEGVLARLGENRHPGIVPVVNFGVFREHQYVIMPCYRRGSLADTLREGRLFALQDLRKRIIPAVNEALHHLHSLGIMHRDLRPSRLMTENTGDRIVLEVSGFVPETAAGVSGFAVPRQAYAAPETIRGEYRIESDYYALGITVYELFTGQTPLENSSLCGEAGTPQAVPDAISFPEGFPDELRELVTGLTCPDFSSGTAAAASGKRWGYQEVRDWLKGRQSSRSGEEAGLVSAGPGFPPYRFDGSSYEDVSSLVQAMLLEPEEGMAELSQGELSRHFDRYDASLAELIRKAETEQKERPENGLAIFCTLMCRICPGIRRLYAGGRSFAGVGELAEAVLSAVAAGNDKRLVFHVAELLRGGFFGFAFGSVFHSRTHTERLDRVMTVLKKEKSLSPGEICCIFGYAFSDRRCFRIGDAVFSGPQNFQTVMRTLARNNPERYRLFLMENRKDICFQKEHLPESHGRDIMKAVLRDADRFLKTESRKKQSSGGNTVFPAGALAGAGIMLALVCCLCWFLFSGDFLETLRNLGERTVSGMNAAPRPENSRSRTPAPRTGNAVLGGGSGTGSIGTGFDYEKRGDFGSALKIFEESCRTGNASGCSRAGWYYQNGKGVRKDYPRALDRYQTACAGGDGLGCYNAGWLYEKGTGVPMSYDTARTWYEKGCDLNNAHSCTALGYIWQYGLGTAKNKDNAISYFEKGCKLGYQKACEIRKAFVFVE